MKKLLRTVILALLSLIISVSVFACGGSGNAKDVKGGDTEGNKIELVVGGGEGFGSVTKASGDLTIKYLSSGFGSTWIDKVASGFMTAFPDVKVHLENSSQSQVIWAESVGSVYKGVDLYVLEGAMHDYINSLVPIDDVYASVWGNEDQTIKEKIDDRYIEEYTEIDGKMYSIPAYAGAYGFLYNSDLVPEEEAPVTTNEMLAICQDLKDAGATPLIFSGEKIATYWEYAVATWNAQYGGLEAFYEAQKGKIYDAQKGEYVYDESSMYQQSMLEATSVAESFLWYPKHFIDSQSTGYQYIVAQRNFLNGGYGFMYSGSWTLNEMSTLFPEGYDFDVRFMRTPVISSIINNCPSIESDEELAALVRAIDKDGKEAGLTGTNYEVTQADFDRIYDARTFIYVGAEGANFSIPRIDGDKVHVNLAKLFLTYMYSDHGICQHTMGNAGAVLPVKVDISPFIEDSLKEMNNFYQDAYSILLSSKKMFNMHRGGVFMNQGVSDGAVETLFGSKDAGDRSTALDQYNKIKANAPTAYKLAMQQAGIDID